MKIPRSNFEEFENEFAAYDGELTFGQAFYNHFNLHRISDQTIPEQIYNADELEAYDLIEEHYIAKLTIEQVRNATLLQSPEHEWYRIISIDYDTVRFYNVRTPDVETHADISELEHWRAYKLVEV